MSRFRDKINDAEKEVKDGVRSIETVGKEFANLYEQVHDFQKNVTANIIDFKKGTNGRLQAINGDLDRHNEALIQARDGNSETQVILATNH